MAFSVRSLVSTGTACLIGLLWVAVEAQSARERDEAIHGAIERNDNLAIALESYVVRTLQNADMLTRFIERATRESGGAVALERARADGLIDDRLYQGVGVINAEGHLVATTLPGNPSDVSFSDREHFQTHVPRDSGTIFVGKPIVSKILGRFSIPITRRVNGPDGSFAGVVIAQIAPGRFTDFYKRAKLTAGDVISVIGLDGAVRVRRAGDLEEAGTDYRSAKGFHALQHAPVGNYTSRGLDGIQRFLSFRRLAGFPLAVTVGVAEESVLASLVERHSRYRAAAALVSAVLAGLAAILVEAFRRRDEALGQVLRRESELKVVASHDVLTGLANRARLEERAREAIDYADQNRLAVACLFLDLDNFKNHNDAHGHAAGDEILRRIAEILRDSVRPEDTVARIGGDEFVVLLQGLSDGVRGASAVARKVIQRLAEPILTKPREVTVTGSIGISLYPKDGRNLQDLLRRADAAMYQAKDDGRSRFVLYGGEASNKAAERLYIEEELRRALRLRQFELFYQPKVDLMLGSPVGVEALIRWNHPLMGMVAPSEFIPIAEESGLVLPLGQWVLETACAQMKAWQDAGLPPIHVAVNVSALQFKQTDFVEIVANALDSSGLAPECLELEITESMLIGQPEAIKRRLMALKEVGVSIALDDFGTGYSNLQYLKKLPLDALKIDRSFVSDIPDDADGASITKAVINMGRSLGMQVVAEGVETHGQVAFLVLQGCSCGQGYLYSEPLPASSCLIWLLERLPPAYAEDQKVDRAVA